MGKLVFAAVLIIIGFIIGRILTSVAQAMRVTPPPRLLVVARQAKYAGIVLAALIVFFSLFVSVDSGHVGVVTVFGRVEPEPLYNGLHLILPWKDVRQMSIQIQKHESKYDAVSIDIQAVHTVMAINYAIQSEYAPEIFRSIGMNYQGAIIDPAASEVLKANTAVHPANDILQQRPKIKADVQSGLTTWLAKYHILVKEVSIKDIHFEKDFEHAVEEKQIAQQIAQKKKYEVEQATQDALSKVATAKGEGDSAKAKAEGDAAALRIRAAAEAEYNQKVAMSLTPVLIQQQYLQRWNGVLPMYSLGDGKTGLLLQMPGQPAR